MQLIISKPINYNKDRVFFSKTELQIILQTYSKQVSSGICKDYSIDNKKQKAIFSFFVFFFFWALTIFFDLLNQLLALK